MIACMYATRASLELKTACLSSFMPSKRGLSDLIEVLQVRWVALRCKMCKFRHQQRDVSVFEKEIAISFIHPCYTFSNLLGC